MLDICTFEIYPNPQENISNLNFPFVILDSCLKLRVDYVAITVTYICDIHINEDILYALIKHFQED